MKHPAGSAPTRRSATARRKVRLNLQRRPAPEPKNDPETEQKSNFWKWVALVALFHVLAIAVIYLIFEMTPAPQPPVQMISLLPAGDVVKGTPGQQEAHQLGHTTTASVHASAPAPPTPAHPAPPKPPTPTPPKPAPSLAADKPAPQKPAKPTPPKPAPPKVKVDLTLQDAPDTPAKPTKKTHPKKTAAKTDDAERHETVSKPDSTGLSREKIAEKLGEKMDNAGTHNAVNTGVSGSANAHENSFADFYDSIRDQVMEQWESPNLTDETAVNPVVEIHVEKDGRVPPESVYLVRSSGNATYDDSALAAAKSLGYLHEPLPDGCPPDIPITFKLTR